MIGIRFLSLVPAKRALVDVHFERRQMLKEIALTGIKPTGTPHIGNYLGMVKPALELIDNYQALYFIADYHALTTVKDRKALNLLIYDIAAAWLALGLNPDKVFFFRQSEIPEVFEFTWILACFTSKGLLNRAHAYKAAVEANTDAGKPPDTEINAGLFNYPVLMAADILVYGSHVVPVGLDQKQHVEIVQDIAAVVNSTYGNVLTIPKPLIHERVMTIPGIDGRKMSKNYNNTIPIFADDKTLYKRVMRIVTDSRAPEESKDPESCNVFAIYKNFASAESLESRRKQYLQGGLAYRDIKQELYELLKDTFREKREVYLSLKNDRWEIDHILKQGAEKARGIAAPIIARTKEKIGLL
jgi:tryptophanyl-tRNA synthetase